MIDDSSDSSYTSTSLSIVDENNKMITKTVKRSLKDVGVPKKLLRLEDKIDEITGSDRWVGKSDEQTTGASLPYSRNKIKSFYYYKNSSTKTGDKTVLKRIVKQG